MSETSEPNPLEVLTLRELRQRTSVKWRTHPRDVLPLWVAEMDVPISSLPAPLRTSTGIGSGVDPA